MSEERKYAVLSKDSIKLISETVGFESLSDDIATALAEDISYRLREAAQCSVQFMKHGRRKKLTCEDFSRALCWSDVEPICGSTFKDLRAFRYSKEAELFFVEDKEINLAEISLDIKTPVTNGKTSINAQWLALEGVNKGSSCMTLADSASLSPELIEYYEQVTTACLSRNETLMKTALDDLRSNNRIGSLLPFLVNFVARNISKVSHNLKQLARLLYILHALVNNSNLFLGPYFNQLVSPVTYCILEPLAASINPLNDHWILRDSAVMLLAQILRSLNNQVGSNHEQLVGTFEDVVTDSARPLCSHYGAVMGLIALGPKAVECTLLPHLPAYWLNLSVVLDDTSITNYQNQQDASKVLGALRIAGEVLLLSKVMQKSSLSCHRVASCSDSPDHAMHFTAAGHVMTSSENLRFDQKPSDNMYTHVDGLYRMLTEYLGESLGARLDAIVENQCLLSGGIQTLWNGTKIKTSVPIYGRSLYLRCKTFNADGVKRKRLLESNELRNKTSKAAAVKRIRCSSSRREVFTYPKTMLKKCHLECTMTFDIDGFTESPSFQLKKMNINKTMGPSKVATINRQMKVSGKKTGLLWQRKSSEIPRLSLNMFL